MKKYLFNIFVLVLTTMVSCQKSNIVEGVISSNDAQPLIVAANITNNSQTRVALTPDTNNEGKPIVKVAWKDSGEAFRVYGVEEDPIHIYGPSTFSQIDDTNNFSGTDPYQHSWYYFATYPASDLITVQRVSSEAKISYDKSNFTSQNGKLSEERTLMYDEVNTINSETLFDFEHLTTLLMPEFRIDGDSENLGVDKIISITFKDMLVPDGTADFNIDCTSHAAEDDIYVYLPFVVDGCYGDDESYSTNKTTIEVVVNTTDAKIYEGTITIPAGTTLQTGLLYTANIWLTQKVFTNVITYTTADNSKLTFSQYDTIQDAIDSHTFENGIGKISLKNDVTSIHGYGITSSKLKSLALPSVITRLEAMALGGNTDLTSVDLTYITDISNDAFASCKNLSQITMPQSEFTIGDNAFVHCGPSVIDLSNATSIGNYAFNSNANLTTVIVNRNTPATIGISIFHVCNALENIYVPDAAVSAYQSAWSDYENKIKAISEMP